jgi:hypothetical protein
MIDELKKIVSFRGLAESKKLKIFASSQLKKHNY